MAKRGMNIYKRKDGRWEGRYKNGYTTDGKVKYRSIYGKSYSAVKTLLEKIKAVPVNKSASICKCTVGELASLWLSDLQYRIKESSLSNYSIKLKKHILPYFSGMKFEALTAQSLNCFIKDKLNEGLSERYVADIVVLIKSIAKFGSRNYGYINRIEYVSLPKEKERSEKRILDESEQKILLESLIQRNTPSDVGIIISMMTGIRIGELCALKWSDVDLENKILNIDRTVQRIQNIAKKGTKLVISDPKSNSSIRQIPLPDFIIPILNAAKSSNENYILSGTQDLVEPRTMQYRFKKILEKLRLPEVTFHSNRHAFATRCVSLGFDIKTLSEILGHSSVEVTLNRYVHSNLGRKRDCMRLLSNSVSVA